MIAGINPDGEDDDVFYGGLSSSSSERYATEQKATEQEATEQKVTEADVEDQIKKTRMEKRRAESTHDITMLRQKGAEHSAQASKFFSKYRAEEAAQVKHDQMVSKNRRRSEHFIQKAKDVMVKAADTETGLEYLEGRKLEKAKIKIAKLKQKSARFKSKASRHNAKGAKHRQKAVARKKKAQEYLEKSKIHESEAKSYQRRAEKLEKVSRED